MSPSSQPPLHYRTDPKKCISCKLNAGESVAGVAVCTSLLVTCPGRMDYLATVTVHDSGENRVQANTVVALVAVLVTVIAT